MKFIAIEVLLIRFPGFSWSVIRFRRKWMGIFLQQLLLTNSVMSLLFTVNNANVKLMKNILEWNYYSGIEIIRAKSLVWSYPKKYIHNNDNEQWFSCQVLRIQEISTQYKTPNVRSYQTAIITGCHCLKSDAWLYYLYVWLSVHLCAVI